MKEFDLLVIGAGSLGMAIAFRAAQAMPGCTIAVIDKDDGIAASPAAGAMLGCFGEVTKYTFAHEASRNKFKMMYAAHQAWHAWIQEIETTAKETVPYFPGTHIILNTQGGDFDEQNYQAVIDALDVYEEPYVPVNPHDIVGLEPVSQARPLKAVFLPNEGSIDARPYLKILKRACVNLGVSFIKDSVTSIKSNLSSFRIKSAQHDIAAHKVVMAAGAPVSSLIESSGLQLTVMPVLSGAGVAMVARRTIGEPFAHTIRTSNRAGSCGLHLVPLGNKREYIGATNSIFSTPQAEASLGMSHFLSQCAIEQLSNKLYFSKVENWLTGNRPVALDTLPLIGQTSISGLYIADGTYRDGLHCSPTIAHDIVGSIQDGDTGVRGSFSPERSPIALMSQAESIQEFILQEVAAAHEAWIHTPNYYDDSLIADAAERAVQNLYEALDTTFGIHPDIIVALTTLDAKDDNIAKIRNYLQNIKTSPL